MSSKLNVISPVLTELEITVSPEEIEKSSNRVFAQLSKEAKVSGFRKGKAPRAVLRRMFGEGIPNEIRGDILPKYFVNALAEHKLNPISEPDFDAGELVEGEEYTFKVKIEVVPKLESINYEGIEIDKHKLTVSETAIDVEIERLRSAMASINDFEEERPAQMGDQIVLDMKRFEDGEWISAGMPPQNFVLAKDGTPNEIIEAIVGMNVNEEKEVAFGPEKDDGTTLKFLCKVTSIKERKLPDVDDEFAKDIGDFDTLKALRDDIEKRIKENQEKQEDERLKHLLFDKMREANSMELPPSVLKKQSQMMKMQFANMMQNMGDSDDSEEAHKKLNESTEKAAADIVHQYFLNMEIARIETIEVSNEDVDAEFIKLSQQNGVPIPKIKAEYQKSDRISELKNSILERKVFDFVLPKVKLNEIDPPTAETTSEES